MPHEKFSVAHLERLNDPGRLETLPPAVMWEALGNPSPQHDRRHRCGHGLVRVLVRRAGSGRHRLRDRHRARDGAVDDRAPSPFAVLPPPAASRQGERHSAGDRRGGSDGDDQPAPRARRSRSRATARRCVSRGSVVSCSSSTDAPNDRNPARRSTSACPPSRSPRSRGQSASMKSRSIPLCRATRSSPRASPSSAACEPLPDQHDPSREERP